MRQPLTLDQWHSIDNCINHMLEFWNEQAKAGAGTPMERLANEQIASYNTLQIAVRARTEGDE